MARHYRSVSTSSPRRWTPTSSKPVRRTACCSAIFTFVPSYWAARDGLCRSSAHFPKFVLHPSTHFHELRKVMGTSKIVTLVPLFYLTFLDRIRRLWCRNVK